MSSKNILIGITGGISAIKVYDFISAIQKDGYNVTTLLTKSALKILTPYSLQAITNNFVYTDDNSLQPNAMDHMFLAKWADAFIILPCSANCIAKMVTGIADDLLTTTLLAFSGKVAIAPAMNTNMWHHHTTQRNINQLIKDGISIWDPEHGPQACGDVGFGRLPSNEMLCNQFKVFMHSERNTLNGYKILINAGPTKESIDPVRYISNHSSGKQGYALAEMAQLLGAEVYLVSGPTKLSPPNVNFYSVESTQEMYNSILQLLENHNFDIFIGVAAICDYTPIKESKEKLKKESLSENWSLELTQNADIILAVSSHTNRPKHVVGFAAETHNPIENAQYKIKSKQLDLLILNNILDKRIGFNSDQNQVTILNKQNEMEQTPVLDKSLISLIILNKIRESVRLNNP